MDERLSPLAFPVNSGKSTKGLIGEVGEEFNETTEGGEVKEAGASTVKVRSSDVKFEACRVKTCKIVRICISKLITISQVQDEEGIMIN